MSCSAFPRGTGPLVSILIPTRGRPQGLCAAIDSIWSLAANKSHLEFLLKVDTDDFATIEVAKRLETILPLKTVISPRGKGYLDNHNYLAELCKIATGDWLFGFNDDSRIITQDWDDWLLGARILKHRPGCEDICMLKASTKNRPYTCEFGFIRRKVYEVLGRLSPGPHIEPCLFDLLTLIDASHYIPIYIDHLDQTMTDTTRKDVQRSCEQSDWTSNALYREKLNDGLKLIAYLEQKAKESPKLFAPADGEQIWMPTRENIFNINHQISN